jgi:hypothetical protein
VLAAASGQLALSHILRMPAKGPHSHAKLPDPILAVVTHSVPCSPAGGSSIWSGAEIEHGHFRHTGQTRTGERTVTAITLASTHVR